MKKRRIMATITAMAIAVAGLIVPASEKNGINIDTSAAHIIGANGGLWLSQVKDTTDGIIKEGTTDLYNNPNDDVNVWPYALAIGDVVQLNIRIPDLGTDLANVQLNVAYDTNVFECIQWYRSGHESEQLMSNNPTNGIYNQDDIDMINGDSSFPKSDTVVKGYRKAELSLLNYTSPSDCKWPYAGDYIGNTEGVAGAQEGDANYKKTSQVTAYFTELDNDNLYKDLGLWDKDSEGNPTSMNYNKYSMISMNNPIQDTTNLIKRFNGNTVDLHARFRVKSTVDVSAGAVESVFAIVEAKFTDKNHNTVWTPDVLTVNPKICDSITGKLIKYDQNHTGYTDDAENFDSDTYIGIKGDAASSYWWSDNTTNSRWVKVDEDGNFTIRGILSNVKYSLKTNLWCELGETTSTKLTSNNNNWKIWLYGDVNYDGQISASDATQILKYLVGKPSEIYNYQQKTGEPYITQDLDDNDIKVVNKIDNIYGHDIVTPTTIKDDVVSVKSATQILLKCNNKSSLFKTAQRKLNLKFFTEWLGKNLADLPTEIQAICS